MRCVSLSKFWAVFGDFPHPRRRFPFVDATLHAPRPRAVPNPRNLATTRGLVPATGPLSRTSPEPGPVCDSPALRHSSTPCHGHLAIPLPPIRQDWFSEPFGEAKLASGSQGRWENAESRIRAHTGHRLPWPHAASGAVGEGRPGHIRGTSTKNAIVLGRTIQTFLTGMRFSMGQTPTRLRLYSRKTRWARATGTPAKLFS